MVVQFSFLGAVDSQWEIPWPLTVPVVHENLEMYEVLIAPLNPPIFTMFGVHMISMVIW
jgi:hypothetical protein